MNTAIVISGGVGMTGRQAVIGVRYKCRLPVTYRVAHITVNFSAHFADAPVRIHRIVIIR